MTTKVCSRCGKECDASTFIGKSLRCKECRSAYQREWYEKNKDHKIEQCRRLYEKDKDKIRARHREYNKNNAERVRSQINGWYKAARRGEKGEKALIRIKTKCLIKNIIKGSYYSKTSKTATLLGCSYEELFLHLGPRPSPDHHLDHICPCSQATTEDELLKLQHYTNLQWLPAEENLSKSDSKTPEGEEMCRILLGREWIEEPTKEGADDDDY